MDQYLTAIKYIKGHPALCSLICSYETKLQNIRFFSKVTRKKKITALCNARALQLC